MKQDIQHTEKFLKGLTNLTGLSYKKVQQYVKSNNPFNILEHPHIMEPNEKQLEKIGLLNEFISSYNILKVHESNDKITLNSSSVSGQYFLALLGGMKDKERFMVAFLDSGNNIIETKTMSEGSIGQTAVYPREILKYALACDCNAVILAHNHPGGSQNLIYFILLKLKFWITLLWLGQTILPWRKKGIFLISVKVQQIMMLLY